MNEAARQGDPIAHTSALSGLLAGLAVGAGVALIGVAIAGTGGLGGGGYRRRRSLAYAQPAARASLSKVLCDKHGPNLADEGSGSVYINGMPASRVDDHSTCGGKISAGSSNVFIGGETGATKEINHKSII